MTYTLSQGNPGCRDGVEYVRGSGKEHQVTSSIQHWQLRDLLSCPERREEVYYVNKERVGVYHPRTRQQGTVLGELPFEPTSMATGCGYVAAGGGRSQLVFKSMDGQTGGQTSVGGSINNAMDISLHHGGDVRLLISNNDETIKVFSLPSLLLADTIRLPTAVNYAAVSPDASRMVAVGDSHDVFLFELRNNAYHRTATLRASNDSSFSCAWSHSSDKFAVASQDGYVTVWDVRSSHKLAKLSARQMVPNIHLTGACRNVKFSPSSSVDLLVFTEHTTYAHVVDARTFNEQQILKVPGNGTEGQVDISGVCFSPDAKALFVSTPSSIIEYDVDTISRRTFPYGSII